MKTKNLFTVAAISAGLAFGVTAQAKEEKHEEQTINSSDVPAAVQQAAQAEAKGGTIVRWEKEGANFEAVIEKNGKQIGVEMDANGKVLGKHNEAKEQTLIASWIALSLARRSVRRRLNAMLMKCGEADYF